MAINASFKDIFTDDYTYGKIRFLKGGVYMQKPNFKMGPIIIDCGIDHAKILSEFYSDLLDWNISHPAQDGTAAITSKEGNVIAFQETDTYHPPVWPWKKDTQGQMMHFDLIVEDLQKAIDYAVSCGATLTEEIYFDDSRTMLDPAGHPFCLDTFHS